MRWPWQRGADPQRLVLRRAGSHWAFVLTDGAPGEQPPRLLRWGLLAGAPALPGGDVLALLDPADYQVLKVDTPAVPPDELKAAARWQIKELIDADSTALTLDVMHVGGDVQLAHRKLFVVAASSPAIAALTQAVQPLNPRLGKVDIWETALRNLVTAQAARDGLSERACAALLLGETATLLVVCAGGELHYTRRLIADPALAARAQGQQPAAEAEIPMGLEYQPGGDFEALAPQESPLIVEVQRSIDVWERSWPDLPLARLYLLAPAHADEIAALIQRDLGLLTLTLDALGPFAAPAPAPEGPPAAAFACVPLLGAALRVDEVKL